MRRWLDMIVARQSVHRIAMDAGMYALAGLADLMPRMKRRMAACRLIEDIEYARHDGVILRLDILQPETPGPHPVIIYLHGGAFAIGSKRTHRALAAVYASRGYVACSVDYRLAPEYPFPAALEDACAAWLWAADFKSVVSTCFTTRAKGNYREETVFRARRRRSNTCRVVKLEAGAGIEPTQLKEQESGISEVRSCRYPAYYPVPESQSCPTQQIVFFLPIFVASRAAAHICKCLGEVRNVGGAKEPNAKTPHT